MNLYKVSSNFKEEVIHCNDSENFKIFLVEIWLLFDSQNGPHILMLANSWGDQLACNLGKKPGREKKGKFIDIHCLTSLLSRTLSVNQEERGRFNRMNSVGG